MASKFTKQEQIVFDEMVEGFDDLIVIGKSARVLDPLSDEEMERAGDRFWLPVPMISASYDGFDQTSNFEDLTELQVPLRVGYHKSVPVKMSSKQLRVESAMREKARSAKQKLASDVNFALFQKAALQGSIFLKRTVAATGYDDISLADAAMTEKGVPLSDRRYFAAPRVANAMAGNLASRPTDNSRDRDAYAKAMISTDVAGFEVYKNDQSYRLAAATGGAILVNGANQDIVPAPTATDDFGEEVLVDNRYSDLVVDGGTYANVKAGDAFTLGINSVHMITKQDTGQLQTYRVISKPAAATLRVAPAIIASGPYQNVTAAPADDEPLVWLNTAAADVNPFFRRGSLILLPGTFSVDPEDGWQVMRARTDLGIGITYTRQGEINDLSTKIRWDIDFGAEMVSPEQAGAEMFGQS